MNKVADWQARARAIDVTTSFSVVAPAGSGKTELLTQRLLALLATVEYPEEVLAITFTRKAAEEMTDRLLNALRHAQTPLNEVLEPHQTLTRDLAKDVLSRDNQLGWRLLDNPNRLRLKTIDGLCSSITQQLPIEAKFGASVSVAEDAQELYREATYQLLEDLKDTSDIADYLAKVLLLLDNKLDRFESLMCSLLAKRDQWLKWIFANAEHAAFMTSLADDLHTLNEERLCLAAEKLQPIASELCELLDFAASNLQPDNPLHRLLGITSLPPCDSEHLSDWQIIVNQLLTAAGTPKKTIDKRQGFPTGKQAPDPDSAKRFDANKAAMLALIGGLSETPGLVDALLRCRELVLPSTVIEQGELIEAIMQILPYSVAHLWTIFALRSQVDYIEINRSANSALGDDDTPSDIALRLDYQIKHILVDEFQDTSPPQLSLLERLTSGWQPGDGRTLFIVGDAMQSCYGFRDANVGIFINACANGIGHVPLEPLQLTVNFRSQQGIIDWVNHAFEHAFPTQNDASSGAVAFSHAIAQKPALADPAVRCHAIIDDDSDDLEAARIVEIINDIRRHSSTDSVAILVRARTHLKSVLAALQQANIAWLATDIDPLSDRGTIRDLLNLYASLDTPADDLAWAALLRSPMVGLKLADLLRLRASSKSLGASVLEGDLEALGISADATTRVAALRQVMLASYANRQRFSARETLYRTWCSLGGDALAATEGHSVLMDVQRFLACVDTLEGNNQGRHLSVEQLTKALEKLYASPDATQENAVQVLTIHKSKGLEFDHVIIPGLHRTPRAEEKSLVLWQHLELKNGREGFLLAPWYHQKDDAGLYRLLAAERKRRTQLESTRLFYVGVTRAIKRLHLLANVASDDKTGLKQPTESTLLASIWPTFQAQAECVRLPHSAKDEGDERMQLRQSINRFNRRLANYPSIPQDGYQWILGEGARNVPDPEEGIEARIAGVILHRALELMNVDALLTWPAQPNRLQRLSSLTKDQRLTGCQLQSVLECVDKHLLTIAKDTDNHWIFDAVYSRCEWQVIANDGRQYIIDRVVWDDQERATIIDYKTATPRDDEDIQDFIRRESEVYRFQLQQYTSILGSLGYKVVRSGIYFTGIGRWHTLIE